MPDAPGRGSRMTDSAPAGRRVLFYSHDGTGLGHLRITLGVATAYARLRRQDSLLLVTGSLQAGAFALPDNLDYVKLPAMPKRDLYASLPPTEGYTGSHNSTIRFRTALALATIQALRPAPGRDRSRSCRAVSRARARPSTGCAVVSRLRPWRYSCETSRSGPNKRDPSGRTKGSIPCSTRRMTGFSSTAIVASSIRSRPTGCRSLLPHARAFAAISHRRRPGDHRRRSAMRWEPATCPWLPSPLAAVAMAACAAHVSRRVCAIARVRPFTPTWLPDRCFRSRIGTRS